MHTGQALLDLVASARTDILLAAPYIKVDALDRVLASVPTHVKAITCVTRWLAEDIAAGVCDLQIFDLLKAREGATLRVQPFLHAKYFRADRFCLIGSANITHRGLGWVAPCNLELLIPASADDAAVLAWEAALMNTSVSATEDMKNALASAAEDFGPQSFGEVIAREVGSLPGGESALSFWVPLCTTPERLWDVYRGKSADTMVTSAYNAAISDLKALMVPPGLPKASFDTFVVTVFTGFPFFGEIEARSAAGFSDNDAHEYLVRHLGQNASPSAEQTWRTIKAWITHFMPVGYLLQTSQEVLFKGRQIQR